MPESTPLLMFSSGAMLTRQRVSELLKGAALAIGDKTAGISPHSLRGGGATALYSNGYTREQIMYLGRWKSDSWMIYAKMTKENLGNVAQALATARYTVVGRTQTLGEQQGDWAAGGPDLLAWWDPVDDCTFVLIHTEFDRKEGGLLANYTDYETWDQHEAELKGLNPRQRLRWLLAKHCRVYTGYPREVETWLEITRVYPSMGGVKFIGPLSLEQLQKFSNDE